MKLSEYFNSENLVNDAEVSLTHYGDSQYLNTITFVLNEEYLKIANENPNISAIITYRKFIENVYPNKGLVISDNPKKDFFLLHNWMFENNLMKLNIKPCISKTAKIAETAIISKNVIIGDNVEISAYAVIEDYTVIGDNTYIGPNVVIGARGLHNTRINDESLRVIDAGGVTIGKNCEVLSGAIVQKSYFCEFTEIGDFSKISIKSNISHGCKIGKRTLVAGNCNISGFNIIGNDVWIGPSSVSGNSLKIGDRADIKIGSVIIKDVKNGESVSGNFAYNHILNLKEFLKRQR